jgi:hypothetical protein
LLEALKKINGRVGVEVEDEDEDEMLALARRPRFDPPPLYPTKSLWQASRRSF